MAPEYLYSGEISPQCDIYSLGVLILEITTREKNCSNDKDMAARNFIIDVSQHYMMKIQILFCRHITHVRCV